MKEYIKALEEYIHYLEEKYPDDIISKPSERGTHPDKSYVVRLENHIEEFISCRKGIY